MKIYYDSEVNTAYIELSKKQPDGVVEISDYLNLDTTKEGEITGIELINASKKISIETLFKHKIDTELLKTFYAKSGSKKYSEIVRDSKNNSK